jgi:toxin HigB-1
MAIASFKDRGTEDVFEGRDTKAARRVCPPDIKNVARRKLDRIDQAAYLEDLRSPLGRHLEKLRGDRAGQYSVRISDRYRVCFVWVPETGHAESVEIVDYH